MIAEPAASQNVAEEPQREAHESVAAEGSFGAHGCRAGP